MKKKTQNIFLLKNLDRLIPVMFDSIGYTNHHWRFLITVLILTFNSGRVRLSCTSDSLSISF